MVAAQLNAKPAGGRDKTADSADRKNVVRVEGLDKQHALPATAGVKFPTSHLFVPVD